MKNCIHAYVLTLLLGFTLNGSFLLGQQTNREKIDSLLSDVIQPEHDSLKMRALAQLVARYWYNDLDSSQYYGNWAVSYADSIENWSEDRIDNWVASSLVSLGAAFSIYGNADTALQFFDRGEELFRKHELMEGLASVYGNRSYDYFSKGWLEMAYETNAKSLEIYEKLGRTHNMALCYVNMGDVHSHYERHQLAAEMYSKALNIHKEARNYAAIVRSYHSISGEQRFYDQIQARASLDSAEKYIPLALEEQKYFWAGHFYSLGKLEANEGNYLKSETYILRAIDTALIHNADHLVLTYEGSLPAVMNALGKYEESIAICDKVLPTMLEQGMGLKAAHTLGYKAKALEKIGRYQEALGARINYEELNDSLVDVQRLNSIDEAQAKFQVAEKEKELALRAKERDAMRAQNDLIMKGAIGGGISLILIGAFFIVGLRNRKKRVELEKVNAEILLKAKEEEAIKLQEVERLKSRFFANISHEFRTPLTLILGPAHELKTGLSEEDVLKYANTIERNGEHLLRLIDQLLELSRAENRGIQIVENATDLERFTLAVLDIFKSHSSSKSIRLNFSYDNSIPHVLIDRDKIEKVLFNFLSNAHKFTPVGGEVSCAVKKVGDQIEFTVADNGPGIDSEHIDRIFDRFYQTEIGVKANGTGIGLALSKELSELLGGKISVQSEPGVKTEFSLQIPLKASNDVEERFATSLKMTNHLESTSIENVVSDDDERPVLLIVEDNDELRRYTLDILKGEFQIIQATNGIDGLEMACEHMPDLILTDIMMPDMDGTEMCQRIKSNPLTDHIPIVMLTAKSTTANKISGLEVGADDYLLKPFNARELVLKIKNLLRLTNRNREKFKQIAPGDSTSLVKAEPVDSFIILVNEILDSQYTDPDLSVEKMSELLSMSRSQLFRKMKSCIDQTPVAYIRRHRLHKAKEFIVAGDLSISEICYEVGFSSPAYFAKSFKEEFGVSPSEYHL